MSKLKMNDFDIVNQSEHKLQPNEFVQAKYVSVKIDE